MYAMQMYVYIYIYMRVLWYAHAYEIIQIYAHFTYHPGKDWLRFGWESVSARVKSLKGRVLANWVCAICLFSYVQEMFAMFM